MSRSTKALSIAAALALSTAACGGDDAAAFCDAARELSGLDPTADVDFNAEDPGAAMAAAFGEFSNGLSTLEESAPSEIEGDLQLLISGVDTLSEALEAADGDLIALATDPEMAEQLEALDGPEFEAAANNVETYVRDECGVEFDG
ncbi:MAG: hypothetical protein AAF962_18705 [Actinomycetota bacterium]